MRFEARAAMAAATAHVATATTTGATEGWEERPAAGERGEQGEDEGGLEGLGKHGDTGYAENRARIEPSPRSGVAGNRVSAE